MLSIIIVHYDTAEELGACLDSLENLPPGVEVVVVDNHSPTNPIKARSQVAQHPQMSWVDLPENLGFGGGVHQGVEAAKGDRFFILNPDTTVNQVDWSAFIAEIEDDRIVCADLRSENNRRELPGWFAPSLFSELARKLVQGRIDRGMDWPARLLRRRGLKPGGLAWVTGAALALTRKRWEQLGGFDPAFFLFFEDIDLCLRHRKAGGLCVISKSIQVMHKRGVASGRHSELAENHYRRSQEIFWDRHGGWWSRHWMTLIVRVQRRRRVMRYHWRKRR